MLAMNSAFVGADAVDACLRRPAEAAAALKQFRRQRCGIGPKEFSWFIYRVTNPTMRDLFMGPRNTCPHAGGAAVGAGRRRIRQDADWPFPAGPEGVYYLISLANLKRTFTAWRSRKHNIRNVDAVAGR